MHYGVQHFQIRVLVELEGEPVRLSEAIRAGQKYKDIRSTYVVMEFMEAGSDTPECRTCAIGGALMCALGDGFNVDQMQRSIKICESVWPELKGLEFLCPMHGEEDGENRVDCDEGGSEELQKARGNPLEGASHLFSDHRWRKAQVSDWVETEVEKANV